MKILAIILGVLGVIAAAVAGLAIYAAVSQPDRFSVERSTVIEAPPEKIYPLIEDFRAWRAWSPFETPDLKRRYSTPSSGVGATYAWEGGQSGSGAMVITEAAAPSRIAVTLNMIAPLKATNDVVFTLTPEASGTRVTWTMSGGNTLPSKIMHVFMSMDGMVGGMFEQGLGKLKAAAEKP